MVYFRAVFIVSVPKGVELNTSSGASPRPASGERIFSLIPLLLFAEVTAGHGASWILHDIQGDVVPAQFEWNDDCRDVCTSDWWGAFSTVAGSMWKFVKSRF